ncbi:MAG: MmgE/PrpD family protein [Bacillota bacterium]
MGITGDLAKFVVETEFEDLPENVVSEGKRAFLNWMGVAIGASRHPSVEIVLSVAKEIGGKQEASILGRRERTDILFAALINGMSSHIFDYDDTHLETVIHPSAPVAPVVMALGEKFRLPGRQALTAFILGIEVECLIGRMVYPSHYDTGWHITATVGNMGAAAAAGKLLKLDVHKMTQALSLAATQASGFREMFGTMTKPFHPGKAAMNGLLAAILAGRGFTSSTGGIEAPRGFAAVTSSEKDWEKVLDGMGKRFETLNNSYKPYACGVVSHPIIDACIRLRDEHNISYAKIREINITVNPLVVELTGKTDPQTGLEGKFSSYHSAAVALIDGEAGVAQYTDERVKSPEVAELRRKIKFSPQPQIRKDECILAARLAEGPEIRLHVEHAKGSLENPMTDIDLQKKFISLTKDILAGHRAAQLIEMIGELDNLNDISAIIPN